MKMKKILLAVAALGMVVPMMAQSPEVTIKKGKAILTEAYYYELKMKAAEVEELQNQLAEANKQLNQVRAELNRAQSSTKLRTFNDSASYAIGKDIATTWQQQQLGINLKAVAQSLNDIDMGKNTWTQKEMQPLLTRFQQEFETRQKKQRETMMASLEKNKADGAAFLKENAKSKAIYTTKSGLQYKIVKKGEGKKPTVNSTVKVNYTGTLIDGKKFDSSYDRGMPAEFPVGAVIPGWTEGLQLMNEGAKYIFYIPYNLAYGEQMAGDIPPGSTLVFEVELLEVKN